MADEQTQALDDTAWWAFEVPSDGLAPALSFDEPLEWPEVASDDVGAEADGGAEANGGAEPDGPPTEAVPYPPSGPEPADSEGHFQFPPVPNPSALLERERSPRSEAGDQAVVAAEHHLETLPESIWAADAQAADNGSVDAWRAAAAGSGGVGTLGAGNRPSSAFYAESEPGRSGRRFPFDLRPGHNTTVVALISFVSVVLLLMFLSVRARNNVPVEPTRQAPADDISASRPLNTVPLTTTTPTIPPATIALSDLVPPADDGPSSEPGATATAPVGGAGAGAAPRAGTATTAPRAAAPSGGGGGGAASPQTTTATTAPPSSGSETTTPPASNNTSNNSGSSTNNTTWRPQTTSATTAPAFTVPTVDFPGSATTTAPPYTWPPTFPKQ